MPNIVSFTINNFKGIKKASIDLDRRNKSPVITLIGLNESGKTTILEALSYFVSQDKDVSALFQGDKSSQVSELIPIHSKAAFNGSIKVIAHVQPSVDEVNAIRAIAASHKIEVDTDQISQEFSVSRDYSFVDSKLSKTMAFWNFQLSTRKTKRGKFVSYRWPNEDYKVVWSDIVRIFEEGLPKISYFPTFIVEMPPRIYLQETPNETSINRYYRNIFQEILDDIGGNLSIQRHVLDRVSQFKAEENSPIWISIFWGTPTRGYIDSVFQKIGHAVTREVIGRWSKVFQRPSGAKSISIEWNVDTENNDIPYATFYVSDGESRYNVSERSLGFRWFFSFLLFTSFRKGSKRPTIFLFDEPAANLHAKAQAELLSNFDRIIDTKNKIIYSTHSHHMINPKWLSASYIVENTSIDYDNRDVFELNSKPTDVTARLYRDFASQYPNRVSYFQPIIEKLEYVAPQVVGHSPFVLVEGISDYHALRYVKDLDGLVSGDFSLIPGSGAGASAPLLSYLIGRGEKFVVLLDDDTAGRKAFSNYVETFYLPNNTVITLCDLDGSFKGMKLENLIDTETKQLIKQRLQTEKSLSKKQIGLYLAEACSVGGQGWLSNTTYGRIKLILDKCSQLVS